jgi:hypothetical protein
LHLRAIRLQQLIKDMKANAILESQDNVKAIKLLFSDVKIPEFKPVFGFNYVRFGEAEGFKDKYPDYLLGLYSKSAKHGAIIKGKVDYIHGGGLQTAEEDVNAQAFLTDLKKIDKESILDIELFGGFYWQIIPTFGGGFKIYHIDFGCVRTNKDRSKFYYKKNWSDRSEREQCFPAYKSGLTTASIFGFMEYRPGRKPYSLPGYIASINYIEADIEVSKATLTNAKTGFSATKFLNFYNGIPSEEAKGEVTNQFEHVATGSEGKKLIIGFNNDPAKTPQLLDLGASDLTKEDFTAVDNLITNNIFTGAQITHPLLFGIQQEGKLGGGTELREAFDIFKNTYVNAKQKQFEDIVNFFAKKKGIQSEYKLKDIDPIGVNITPEMIAASLSKEEIRERLGYPPELENVGNAAIARAINSLSPLVANKVLESMTKDEIRSLAGLFPTPGGSVIAGTNPNIKAPEQLATQTPVNDNLKNLTAKQHQQLERIIRQYQKDRITKEVATILLKSGLGLTDEEVLGILGEETQSFSSDDEISALFEAHGESNEGYEVVRTATATFDEDEENIELVQAFRDVLERPEPEVAKAGGNLRPPLKKPPISATGIPKLMIRYSYEVRSGEGPELLPTSRDFCKKMIALNKFYSRQDIQKISSFLGYNVFERVGGFWNDSGIIRKHCRHEWKSNIVIKK